MVLVAGGAGYVGSHVAKALRNAGRQYAVLDNLEKGHEAAVLGAPLLHGDLRDQDGLRAALRSAQPSAVMLFAGYTSVGESVRNPSKYWANNVLGLINLLQAAGEVGVRRFIFSSSAAVYGEPQSIPIPEDHPKEPTNPYGESKLFGEKLIRWHCEAAGAAAISLRYFNAAGADPDGELGEDHRPEEHLIPLAIDAALGRRPELTIFGDDYPTRDGTCVRDYVHVTDLAAAHVLALDHLEDSTGHVAFNLGSERGFTVREVVETVASVASRPVPHSVGARRAGDPAVLVASNARAKERLGWTPRYEDLSTIVEHALKWRAAHPNGYGIEA